MYTPNLCCSSQPALADAPFTMTQRMLTMHEQVMSHDVRLWSQSFLGCLRTTRTDTTSHAPDPHGKDS